MPKPKTVMGIETKRVDKTISTINDILAVSDDYQESVRKKIAKAIHADDKTLIALAALYLVSSIRRMMGKEKADEFFGSGQDITEYASLFGTAMEIGYLIKEQEIGVYPKSQKEKWNDEEPTGPDGGK